LRIDQLVKTQLALAGRIKIRRLPGQVRYIAGVDVAVMRDHLFGSICVLTFPALDLVDYADAHAAARLPYIPNFLSYREAPVVIKAYKKLKIKPDLILVDGQGIAHPRSLGFASHLGIALGCPTIGCAKSHLYGTYKIPRSEKGAYTLLRHGRKKIGFVLRTRDDVRPLFVSPGHLVDLDDCRKYVLLSVGRYRLPEPIRCAHRMAGDRARQNVNRWTGDGI
jgi:deoxyribonuclease V